MDIFVPVPNTTLKINVVNGLQHGLFSKIDLPQISILPEKFQHKTSIINGQKNTKIVKCLPSNQSKILKKIIMSEGIDCTLMLVKMWNENIWDHFQRCDIFYVIY